MKVEKQYDYKPKWTTVWLGGGFFGLCAALFVYLALTNERRLVIGGLVNLSPSGARVFWWALAVLSSAFVLAAALIAYIRLTTVQRIAVSADGMLFPAGRWTSRESHVPFASITAVKRLEVHGQTFLYIYANGLRYTVVRNMLPGKGDFDDIVAILETKTGEAGGLSPKL